MPCPKCGYYEIDDEGCRCPTVAPGWFQRQFEGVANEVARWPAWMRREAGIEVKGGLLRKTTK